MLKSLNESLVTVIALNGKDDQPSNVGMIYKSKKSRLIEILTLNHYMVSISPVMIITLP